jgi:hypothetical protein
MGAAASRLSAMVEDSGARQTDGFSPPAVAAYGHAFSFMLCGGAEGAAVDWATEVGLANALRRE